jgi:hypothetical protein
VTLARFLRIPSSNAANGRKARAYGGDEDRRLDVVATAPIESVTAVGAVDDTEADEGVNAQPSITGALQLSDSV